MSNFTIWIESEGVVHKLVYDADEEVNIILVSNELTVHGKNTKKAKTLETREDLVEELIRILE